MTVTPSPVGTAGGRCGRRDGTLRRRCGWPSSRARAAQGHTEPEAGARRRGHAECVPLVPSLSKFRDARCSFGKKQVRAAAASCPQAARPPAAQNAKQPAQRLHEVPRPGCPGAPFRPERSHRAAAGRRDSAHTLERVPHERADGGGPADAGRQHPHAAERALDRRLHARHLPRQPDGREHRRRHRRLPRGCSLRRPLPHPAELPAAGRAAGAAAGLPLAHASRAHAARAQRALHRTAGLRPPLGVPLPPWDSSAPLGSLSVPGSL
eukprot:scaffold131035_cov54-Phaeocystis_antarctica.AAC.1